MSTPNPADTSSTSKNAGVTSKLASWISTTNLSAISPAVQTRAKHLMLDGLACALVGARLPWSETATRAILAIEPPGPSTLIGWGPNHKLSPMATTLLNATYIQGFELDDVNMTSPLHNNALLLPALLSAPHLHPYPTTPITGAHLLTAYTIGLEIGPRVGLALGGPDLLTRGFHSGALMGPSAVAASLSSLLHLTPQQITSALGTACTQAGGLMSAQYGSMAKRMQHGFAARSGVLAVALARAGYTGIEDVYDVPYGGFLSCFAAGSKVVPAGGLKEEIVAGLGTRWEVMNVAVKFHACMAALHGTVDCLAALQKEYPERFVDAGRKIVSIESRVGDAAFEHGGWVQPEGEEMTPVGAQMSIAYAAAVQCVDGQVLMEQFAERRLNRSEVIDLMRRVTPVRDEGLGGKEAWKTTVRLVFDDGVVLEESLDAPRFVRPGVSDEEIVRKWRGLVGGLEGMSKERVEGIERIVLNLENEGEGVVERLAVLLEGEVGCAIA